MGENAERGKEQLWFFSEVMWSCPETYLPILLLVSNQGNNTERHVRLNLGYFKYFKQWKQLHNISGKNWILKLVYLKYSSSVKQEGLLYFKPKHCRNRVTENSWIDFWQWLLMSKTVRSSALERYLRKICS